MSSSSPLVSSSRRIGEEEEENGHPPPTSMLFGLQRLEERIINATTTTTTTTCNTIIDIVGCDITIDDIQSAKQELINNGVDLKMDVNKRENIPSSIGTTPLIHFCTIGNLLVVKVLFLIGADCTKLSKDNYWFPMLLAAYFGHLDICKWLFEYGGDAKYQINKETTGGVTPLWQSYKEWLYGNDNEGKICRWLLLNGGGQHLSSEAMGGLHIKGNEEINSNRLVLWMRKIMQYHDTFILLLCGARKRKIHQERSLQILDGHPGIMELIGDYVDLIRGKEFRMLTEFNESVIEYNNTYQSSSDDDDANTEDEK